MFPSHRRSRWILISKPEVVFFYGFSFVFLGFCFCFPLKLNFKTHAGNPPKKIAMFLKKKRQQKFLYPKYPDPSKVPILRTRTPAIQVPTPALEGPRILRVKKIFLDRSTISTGSSQLTPWTPPLFMASQPTPQKTYPPQK